KCERFSEVLHSVGCADGGRGERACSVRETCGPVERPFGEYAVQEPGDERIAGTGSVDCLDLDGLDVSLIGDVAAVAPELDHDVPRARAPKPCGGILHVALARHRQGLREARCEDVDMGQAWEDPLPAPARIPDRVKARHETAS